MLRRLAINNISFAVHTSSIVIESQILAILREACHVKKNENFEGRTPRKLFPFLEAPS